MKKAKPKKEFIECDTCRAKPGSPILCQGCLHNRDLISRLTSATKPKKTKEINLDYRTYGKTFGQFLEFLTAIKSGLNSEIHGPLYVVMSRKRYDEVMMRAYGSDWTIVHDELNSK